ncbi:MAG: DUF2232 domain-containing protein [Deltaproteobacteria bacterium]|nr:DUF2232 domain-containing protein [Deltaproteobacteria bacterium]
MTPPDVLLKGAILTLVLFLPAISGELGWIRTFIPLPAFYILVTTGEARGSSILIKSILAAGVGFLLIGKLQSFFFSVSFLPLAYVLARAVQNNRSVLRAGMTGALMLISTWVMGAFLYGMVEQVQPYNQILETIDTSLTATFSLYQQSSDIDPETLAQIQLAFTRIRAIIPVIFPAILLITVLCTVWINLLLGNVLLKKKDIRLSPWQPYGQWRLPDQLVWLVVASGIGLLLPLPLLSKISLNCMLVAAVLFFFQGLAVLTSLFDKWAVPWAFRFFVYALVLIQAYGIIFLAIAGLIDVWFDLRKSQNETT